MSNTTPVPSAPMLEPATATLVDPAATTATTATPSPPATAPPPLVLQAEDIRKIYEYVRQHYDLKQRRNWPKVVAYIMHALYKVHIPKSERKKIVRDLIETLLAEAFTADDPVTQAFLDEMLPDLIDLFVSVEKGAVRINTKKMFKSCLAFCS